MHATCASGCGGALGGVRLAGVGVLEQANVVASARELATLYLRVDPWQSGVSMARLLLRKTLFYLHRLYTQVISVCLCVCVFVCV